MLLEKHINIDGYRKRTEPGKTDRNGQRNGQDFFEEIQLYQGFIFKTDKRTEIYKEGQQKSVVITYPDSATANNEGSAYMKAYVRNEEN